MQDVFNAYLEKLPEGYIRDRMRDLLERIVADYPMLNPVIKWNQPMFTEHDTFIIGFSVAKKHIALAPEAVAITSHSNELDQRELSYTKELVRLPHDQPLDYELIKLMIDFNREDKKDLTAFWRK